MTEVCIVSAKRTPFGRFLGSLSRLSAAELGLRAAEAVMKDRARSSVNLVIVGNVLSAGQGMNVARQIGIRLKLPVTTPAYSVNMMCGSGMQAVLLGVQAIRAGDASVVLCGGTESMSNAPHLLQRSRTGTKFGDTPLTDSILRDGLQDAFSGDHMAITAERLAEKYHVTREQQDEFAAASQSRHADAAARGSFKSELVALPELAEDEHPRAESTVAQLAQLKPAFLPEGSITAGNSSGINDGAAMLLVASRSAVDAYGWPVLATIQSGLTIGCEPAEMGLGPVHAIRELCRRENKECQDFGTIEINEAFAAQTLSCLNELQLTPDHVNKCGGAIALGHPIGASGARLVAHLAHQIHDGAIVSGLGSLCIGGGMGAAIALTAGDP